MQSSLTVEELCRKLKPVFGDKIDKLYLKYSLSVDREERTEIEQALNALYHKHINEEMITEKVLLEPPSKDISDGQYPLGVIHYAKKNLYPFYLREKDWVRHVCVSGMSGSGKTTFAYNVLGAFVLKKKPFIVFDWKKSFRPLLKTNEKMLFFTVGNERVTNFFKLNINKPPTGVGPKEWIGILCDIINESYFANFGVHKILSETLDQAFTDFGIYKGSENYPTWLQIKDRLEEKANNTKGRPNRENEWLASALRIAHSLTFGAFGESTSYKGKDLIGVEDLLTNQVVFELDSLSTSEKKFFCEFILTYIYKAKKSNPKALTNTFESAIIVDEAHNIFLKERPSFLTETITDMIYRELREYGIGLICLDQHISKLSEVVAGNSACNIAFQQMLPQDIETVSGIMQLKDHKKYFSMLPVGTAIVKLAERYYRPFLIKVPFIDIKKNRYSDEELESLMSERMKFARRMVLFDQSVKPEKLVENTKKLDGILKSQGIKPTNEFLETESNTMLAQQSITQKPLTFELGNDMIGKIVDKISQNPIKTTPKEPISDELELENDNVYKYPIDNSILTNKISIEEELFLSTLQGETEGLPTTLLYQKLNSLSTRKANTIKKKLIEQGKVEEVVEKTASGWKKKLSLTEIGVQILEKQ
ncbi:ATP-binding protein [Candidatus Woesearchaeota archaeon]|nr:ATP-binding protein [Candidatus Woesearchaeota archaeon]